MISREQFTMSTIQLGIAGEYLTVAFRDHLDEIQAAADQAVKQAIEAFDFAGEFRLAARKMMEEALKDKVRHYLLYGEGAKALEKLVKEAFEKATPE